MGIFTSSFPLRTGVWAPWEVKMFLRCLRSSHQSPVLVTQLGRTYCICNLPFGSFHQAPLVSLSYTSWTLTWLQCALPLCHPSPDSPCSRLHPLRPLTWMFSQASLGGVSCSQGHPVLQLLPSVCFSCRFQGICLGGGGRWGGCVRAGAKTQLRPACVYLMRWSANSINIKATGGGSGGGWL